MSSFDWESLRNVRPVAAADYWVDGKSSLMRWFSMEIIGVIPVRDRFLLRHPFAAP